MGNTCAEERIVTCVYCGEEYPPGTPAAGHEVEALTKHIGICDKHPMKKLAEDNALLRRALIGIVGSDSKKELQATEAVTRLMPIPDVDKMNIITAIHAVLQTMPVREEH